MIKSIHKASFILRILSDAYPDGVKLEDISTISKINKSTCVRILDTLIEEQLAERMQFALYRLGAGCFHLTRSGRFDESRLSVCRPVLKWLYKETGHTVLISEIQNGTKYNVDYFVSDVLRSKADEDIMVDEEGTLVLNNCQLGDTTFEDKTMVAGVGSVFGDGSLSMIVAILALVASGVSILLIVDVKKKLVSVAANKTEKAEVEE